MGNPSMEEAKGVARSSFVIFIGIAITRKSLRRGLANYKYWRSIMEAFCAVNDYLGRHGKPQLPEDLLQLIEGYVKASGDEQPIGDVTNHELKFFEKEFSLTTQGVQDNGITSSGHLYIGIPWDLHEYRFSKKSDRCCGNMAASVSGTVEAGYGADHPSKEQNEAAFLLDQDLTVTRKKTLAINKAIQCLNLEVCNLITINRRTTDCDVRSESAKDIKFAMGTSTRGERLWKPRVVVLLNTKIEMNEVEDPYQ